MLRWAQGVWERLPAAEGSGWGPDPEEDRAGEVAHRRSMDKGREARRQSFGKKQSEVLSD